MADEFATALAEVQKKYNTGVGPVSKIALPCTWVSTGNLALDWIVGGGLPLGRTVELSGPPSSGKTTTALQTAAFVQYWILQGGNELFGIKASDKILYLDYEQTIDQEYCSGLGLDIDDDSFLLTQPDTLEEGSNLAIRLIETGRIRLVIWDSVASMTPSAKAQAEIGKALPAVQAKLMSDLGQKLNPILYKHQTLNIWVNHLRDVMDMSGRRPAHLGPAKTTPGGVALKFYETVRMEYKPVGQIKEKVLDLLSNEVIERVGAIDVEVKVTKNKVAAPFKKAKVRVRFGRGFDNFWTAMDILVAQKEIMYSSGYRYFHKVADAGLAPEWMKRATTGIQRPYIKSDQALIDAADEHPEWRQAVIDYATEYLKTHDLSKMDTVREEEPEVSPEELDEILPVAVGGNRVPL